ncbi:MAG: DUF839 domain-containing protein [Polyangiaceae bacterium]|nr:DUF839 domain-containing protein [Polyangiaceae bacterium]
MAGETGPAGTTGAAGRDAVESPVEEEVVLAVDPQMYREDGTKRLLRLATVPLGAEVTGAYINDDGMLFFNAQHPESTNIALDGQNGGFTYDKGTVGYLSGVNINELPDNFDPTPVPSSPSAKETIQTAVGQYKVLYQNGDTLGGTITNGVGVVMDSSGSSVVANVDMPDFNGYVSIDDQSGYLFTNWEWVMGGMSRVKLNFDADDMTFTVDTDSSANNQMLDFGTYGTVANCFGSVSPWGTPLTSEEWGNFGDNTTDWNNPSATDRYSNRNGFTRYTDASAADASEADPFPNTYRYHYIVEITDPQSATPVPEKLYAMGRFEHENSIVMPDQKTVYLSQDSTNGVFFKFVATTAGDLSAGTLYAAKVTQDADSTDPATTGFDLTWIELATGNNDDIEDWIEEYDAIDYDSFVTGQSNYLTDKDAEAWAAGDSSYPAIADGGSSVTTGATMDDRIVFLESRKAARAKGATAEWRKFEGIYINHERAKEAVEGTDLIEGEEVSEAYVYFAIADLSRGLIDEEGDIQLDDRIKNCGGVYRMKLLSNYDVDRIEPVVMGGEDNGSYDEIQCDRERVAQPDNVIVMRDGRIMIGEDGDQPNNSLWVYDPR